MGGLVAFASFLDELKILDTLEANFPVQRVSNNALPVRDILVGFFVTTLLNGKRFRDIRFVQGDPVVAKAFGVKKRIPSDDTVRRLFQKIKPDEGRKLFYAANQCVYNNLAPYSILDWDSTITVRYGHQEGVEVGYNPNKPGRGSHHPLVCSLGGSRLCLDIEMRSGNSHTASGWVDCMERLLTQLPEKQRPWLNRGDVGFCSESFLKWHEAQSQRPNYLLKLRKTKRVLEAIGSIGKEKWEGPESINALQLSESRLQLKGWEKPRRVVLGRRLISKKSPEESQTLLGQCQYHYYAYVTDLSPQQYSCWQIAELYDQRADCENVFDELKNHWGLNGYCSQKQNATEFASRLTLLAYNLWSIFVRFFHPENHQEARNSRREFMLLPGKIVFSQGQSTVGISVMEKRWERIQLGYNRIINWLKSIAPQLKFGPPIATLAVGFQT